MLLAGMTGCATSYWVDRGRDAADVLTLGVGVGLGTKARVGPLQTGVLFDVPMTGLRGGQFTGLEGCDIGLPMSMDMQWLVGGAEAFQPNKFWPGHNLRRKKFVAESTPRLSAMSAPYTPFYHHLTSEFDRAPSYYTQVEAVFGLLISVRVGLNPGEFLDFILGWTTLDLFGDDIGKKSIESGSRGALAPGSHTTVRAGPHTAVPWSGRAKGATAKDN